MGRRGPTPTPTPILKLRGSRLVARRGDEPKPQGKPRRPKALTKAEQAIWRGVVEELNRLGLLTSLDANALERYAQMFVRYRQAHAFILQYGETYPLKDADGKLRCFQQHPQVGIVNKLAVALLRLEQEFGMTPSARARLAVHGGETDDDPLTALMRQYQQQGRN